MNAKWYDILERRPEATTRLLCVPFAGAGASVYRAFVPHLPNTIELAAVKLPGREDRIREAPVRAMNELVSELLEGIVPLLDRPLSLFGHSMGAAIAFELTLRIPERFGVQVSHLFASGRRGPAVPLEFPAVHRLSDQSLIRAIRLLGGTPKAVLSDEGMMQALLPALRADLQLTENYQAKPGSRVSCPVTVLGGRCDSVVTPDGIEAWRENTTAHCSVQWFDGEHFFPLKSARAVANTLRGTLENLSLAQPPRASHGVAPLGA